MARDLCHTYDLPRPVLGTGGGMVCKMQAPRVSEETDRALYKSHPMHIYTIGSISLENPH